MRPEEAPTSTPDGGRLGEAARHIIVSTPVGPLALDLAPATRPTELTVTASGSLVPFWGALETRLHDLATVDVDAGTVTTTRRRIRRALRMAHGPRTAMRLIPILVPPLERVLGQEAAILAYARLRHGLTVPVDEQAARAAARAARRPRIDRTGIPTEPGLLAPAVPVDVEQETWSSMRRRPVTAWRGPVAQTRAELLTLGHQARPLERQWPPPEPEPDPDAPLVAGRPVTPAPGEAPSPAPPRGGRTHAA